MKEVGIAIAILILIALIIWLIWLIRPYIIKHDTTILFTGGLGSGKTLESVKRAMVLIRKNRFFKYYWPNFKAKRIINPIRRCKNKHTEKKYNKLVNLKRINQANEYIKKHPQLPMLEMAKKPLLYSNIPIHFRSHLFGFKKEWATQLEIDHLVLIKEINEYSVVLIDEFPQLLSQFEWDLEIVQTHINEFITFFRHYIGGHLIINAQSPDEIECHVRRKLNIGIWCFDFHAWPAPFLPLFYTNRMCDFMLSDNVQTMSTTYVEDNTRIHFGLFPRKAYDSRCYKPRYKEVYTKLIATKKWKELQTTSVLRLRYYISMLDKCTTDQQKQRVIEQIKNLKRSEKEKAK